MKAGCPYLINHFYLLRDKKAAEAALMGPNIVDPFGGCDWLSFLTEGSGPIQRLKTHEVSRRRASNRAVSMY